MGAGVVGEEGFMLRLLGRSCGLEVVRYGWRFLGEDL